MSTEKPTPEEIAALARKEEEAGIVDQQTAASAEQSGEDTGGTVAGMTDKKR